MFCSVYSKLYTVSHLRFTPNPLFAIPLPATRKLKLHQVLGTSSWDLFLLRSIQISTQNSTMKKEIQRITTPQFGSGKLQCSSVVLRHNRGQRVHHIRQAPVPRSRDTTALHPWQILFTRLWTASTKFTQSAMHTFTRPCIAGHNFSMNVQNTSIVKWNTSNRAPNDAPISLSVAAGHSTSDHNSYPGH